MRAGAVIGGCALTALMLALPAQAGSEQRYTTPGLHLSGDARMGVVYNDRPDMSGQHSGRWRLDSRARLQFQFVGETTGGTRFGLGFEVDKPNRRLQGQYVFFGN